MKIEQLFNLEKTEAKALILSEEYPWKILPLIDEFVIRLGRRLDSRHFIKAGRYVWISKEAKVAEDAHVEGTAIIFGGELRHGAFLRGGVIAGRDCVIGNSCEVKNSILFDGVQLPHYNYVGDSILGYRAHLGAGALTSNLKSDKSDVKVNFFGETINTERRKVGAFVGDGAEIGCNSVICPGTVIGRGVTVYPCSAVRGFVAENMIYKSKNDIVKRV